jgi:hypothetical protein
MHEHQAWTCAICYLVPNPQWLSSQPWRTNCMPSAMLCAIDSCHRLPTHNLPANPRRWWGLLTFHNCSWAVLWAAWTWYINYGSFTLYSPVVTICIASLTFNNSTFCPHSVFVCFVWISEQTAIISLYGINWLVFINETACVYCAVRTGSYI